MRVALVAVLNAAPVLLRDLAGVAGMALVAYGAWLIYQPAGYIVTGAELLTLACLSARGA